MTNSKISLSQAINRTLLSITGKDARTFLQGLLTNDVSSSSLSGKNSAQYTALLNPKGRLLSHGHLIQRNEEDFLLDLPLDLDSKIVQHLKRYTLRRKVNVHVVEDKTVWTSHGSIKDHDMITKQLEERGEEGQVLSYHDGRGPDFGFRYITSNDKLAEMEHGVDVDESGNVYDVFRMSLGVLDGNEALDRIPAECNLDLLDGICFTKGCYVGQELTARTQFKGTIRKRVLPFHFSSSSTPPSTSSPMVWDERPEVVLGDKLTLNDRRIGKWLALSSTHALGLAQVRLDPLVITLPSLQVSQGIWAHPYLPSWWPNLDLETGKPNI